MNNRKRVGDRTLRKTTVDRFRGRTVTVYHSSNRTIRKETWDEVAERRIEAKGG